MYCDYCQRPVAGQKNTHKVRNTLIGVPFMGLGAKVEPYHCPMCGQPVRRAVAEDFGR